MATLSIDKSNWELVRLGDVAHEVRESLTKSDVQVDRSVGLEHIEPGDLHIRTWDELDESSSFTKVFREGHVLFGRRRAYLKKAALADFNGVCSGDITVISANEDLLPSLLPFVVSSDRFFAFAVEHSAGGLSPRVKWKDLANYEFLLPTKGEQAKIAELLWSIDDLIQAQTSLGRELSNVEESVINHRIDVASAPTGENWLSFESCLNLINGRGFKSAEWASSGIPIIRIQNLNGSSDFNYFKGDLDAKHQVKKGDLLFAWSGNRGTSFGPTVWSGDEGALNQHIWKIEICDERLNRDYLFAVLRKITSLVEAEAHGTGGLVHITKKRMVRFGFVFDQSGQAELVSEISKIQRSQDHAKVAFDRTQSMRASLLNDIFDPRV